MKIEHVALWADDIDKLNDFYIKYFNVTSSELYFNEKTKFKSYFWHFEEGSRLEIMNKPFLKGHLGDGKGYAHIAISVGDREAVDSFAQQFSQDGYPLLSGPRVTGDGYYEPVIQDPEGNLLELTTY